MTVTIGRRELLAALGGAVVAWPLAASALSDPSSGAWRIKRPSIIIREGVRVCAESRVSNVGRLVLRR
jgi:hypothetical protein